MLFQAVENPTYSEIRDVCAAAGLKIGVEVSTRCPSILLFEWCVFSDKLLSGQRWRNLSLAAGWGCGDRPLSNHFGQSNGYWEMFWGLLPPMIIPMLGSFPLWMIFGMRNCQWSSKGVGWQTYLCAWPWSQGWWQLDISQQPPTMWTVISASASVTPAATCDLCQPHLHLQLLFQNKVYPRETDSKDAKFRGRIRIELKNDDGTPVLPQFPTSKLNARFVSLQLLLTKQPQCRLVPSWIFTRTFQEGLFSSTSERWFQSWSRGRAEVAVREAANLSLPRAEAQARRRKAKRSDPSMLISVGASARLRPSGNWFWQFIGKYKTLWLLVKHLFLMYWLYTSSNKQQNMIFVLLGDTGHQISGLIFVDEQVKQQQADWTDFFFSTGLSI